LIEIAAMDIPDVSEVLLQRYPVALGQDGDAVLFPFAVADRDLRTVEINILDTETKGLHEPQAASVEEAPRQQTGRRQDSEEALHFRTAQHHGEMTGAPGVGEISDVPHGDALDLMEVEGDGVQRLPLRRGGHFSADGEILEKRAYRHSGLLAAGTVTAPGEKAPHPVHVDLFCPQSVVPDPEFFSEPLDVPAGACPLVRMRGRGGPRGNTPMVSSVPVGHNGSGWPLSRPGAGEDNLVKNAESIGSLVSLPGSKLPVGVEGVEKESYIRGLTQGKGLFREEVVKAPDPEAVPFQFLIRDTA
jgi:hypothetical protein